MTAAIDTSEAPGLAALLATRLCHDLAGSCGTVAGMLELALDPAAADEALGLARDAAAELVARLRLLRVAWGLPGEPLDVAGMAELARGLPGAARLALDLSGLPCGLVLHPVLARLALGALVLGAEALPGGGSLALRADGPAFELRIAGRRAAWPDLPPARADGPRADGPRALAGALLARMAGEAGMRLRLADADAGAPPLLRIEPAAA